MKSLLVESLKKIKFLVFSNCLVFPYFLVFCSCFPAFFHYFLKFFRQKTVFWAAESFMNKFLRYSGTGPHKVRRVLPRSMLGSAHHSCLNVVGVLHCCWGLLGKLSNVWKKSIPRAWLLMEESDSSRYLGACNKKRPNIYLGADFLGQKTFFTRFDFGRGTLWWLTWLFFSRISKVNYLIPFVFSWSF